VRVESKRRFAGRREEQVIGKQHRWPPASVAPPPSGRIERGIE
jgi:hypothetical protein